MLFLLLLDSLVPHLHFASNELEGAKGPRSHLKRTTMLVLAVTLHNLPEGMAVGVVFAGQHPAIRKVAIWAIPYGIALFFLVHLI